MQNSNLANLTSPEVLLKVNLGTSTQRQTFTLSNEKKVTDYKKIIIRVLYTYFPIAEVETYPNNGLDYTHGGLHLLWNRYLNSGTVWDGNLEFSNPSTLSAKQDVCADGGINVIVFGYK